MAEVPEVETIVRDLREAVVGRPILGADVAQSAAVRFPAPEVFAALPAGRRVLGAERRAKHILMPLDGDLLLEVHFMLWGTLLLGPAGLRREPETMVVFTLDREEELHLLDKLGYARTAPEGPPRRCRRPAPAARHAPRPAAGRQARQARSKGC